MKKAIAVVSVLTLLSFLPLVGESEEKVLVCDLRTKQLCEYNTKLNEYMSCERIFSEESK